MWIAAVLLPLHAALAWLVALHWRWGLTAAASVQSVSLVLTIFLTCAYIRWAGLQARTWGRPSLQALHVRPASPPSSAAPSPMGLAVAASAAACRCAPAFAIGAWSIPEGRNGPAGCHCRRQPQARAHAVHVWSSGCSHTPIVDFITPIVWPVACPLAASGGKSAEHLIPELTFCIS